MLVVDVYNKAEWEIQGGDNDTEGRARKSELTLHRMLSWWGSGLKLMRLRVLGRASD